MEPMGNYERNDGMYTEPTRMQDSFIGEQRNFIDLTDDDPEIKYEPNILQMENELQNCDFLLTPIQQQPMYTEPSKRYLRGESAVLLAPPFFDLVPNKSNGSDAIIVRCLSCSATLRGSKRVSSNFIKHLKRGHPEVYKMYENYKISKQQPGFKLKGGTHGKESVDDGNEDSYDASQALGEEEPNSEAIDETPSNPPKRFKNNSSVSHQSETNTNSSTIANDALTEVNLSDRTLQAMSHLFDEKLKSFVNKSDLNDIITKVSNRGANEEQPNTFSNTRKEEHSPPMLSIQVQLNNMRNEFQTLQHQMRDSMRSNRRLQQELELLDKVAHRRKIVVRNLKVADHQTAKEALELLFTERFQLPKINILNVLTISNRNRTQNGKQNFLVELAYESDARALFRNASCLRNTGIFIEPQMSMYAQKRKEKLLVLRRELLRQNNSLQVRVRNKQLIVSGKQFAWDDVLGLRVDTLDSFDDDCDAVEELKQLTNLDLKEFMNVLKNYNVR